MCCVYCSPPHCPWLSHLLTVLEGLDKFVLIHFSCINMQPKVVSLVRLHFWVTARSSIDSCKRRQPSGSHWWVYIWVFIQLNNCFRSSSGNTVVPSLFWVLYTFSKVRSTPKGDICLFRYFGQCLLGALSDFYVNPRRFPTIEWARTLI